MTTHRWIQGVFVVCIAILVYLVVVHYASWIWILVFILLYTVVIGLGAYFIELHFFLNSHNHGDSNRPQIALTFDDGPTDETIAILDILAAHNVPATFFCIGSQIAGREAILKRMDTTGHLIGNHSQHHGFWFSIQSTQKIAQEIRDCNERVRHVIGKSPLLFRPPYGVTNPMVARAIKLCGMQSIGWSLRSYDTSATDADTLLRRTAAQVKHGDIVLLHDRLSITAAILPAWITLVRERGIEIISLDKLLGLPPYQHD
jgi:peptidoglycan-N-acetylglucosamine deacetylase